MKVKWGAHERVLVAGMCVLGIALLVIQNINHPSRLLPQAGSVLLIYLAYIGLNLIVGWAAGNDNDKIKQRYRIEGFLFSILAVSYLLGPGINFISNYAGAGYQGFYGIPLTFGFHPQPFLNVFGGWSISLVLVGGYGGYAWVREWISHHLERTASNHKYRVLAVNQITALLAVTSAIPFVLAAFHLVNPVFVSFYFAFIPPSVLVALFGYYRLFPALGKRRSTVSSGLQEFLWAMVIAIPFSFFIGDDWTPGLLLLSITIQGAMILPLTSILQRSRKDAVSELHSAQTRLAGTEAVLEELRAQLNPHFLFNSLNALYAIALREQSAGAAAGIQQLAGMMRFMLYDNQQDFIPMSSELDNLKSYIALQKLRLPDPNEIVKTDIEAAGGDFLIPPMLLIPFIENAFEHGVSVENPSWICIRLRCTAEMLYFEVRNSLHPALVGGARKEWSGIGLQNVRQRLELLYPDKHNLFVGHRDMEFVVNLTINLSNA